MANPTTAWIIAIILIIIVATVLLFYSQYNPLNSEYYCTEEDRNAEACIQIYKPVCGWTDDKQIQTYSNQCQACVNQNVTFITKGEC